MEDDAKTVLVVCPDVMFISTLLLALDDLKGIKALLKEFSFADGLCALEERNPALVVLQTDCRDEGKGLPLIDKAEELKIPCLVLTCHCFRPALQSAPKRIVLQWLQHDFINKMEAGAKKLLAI